MAEWVGETAADVAAATTVVVVAAAAMPAAAGEYAQKILQCPEV